VGIIRWALSPIHPYDVKGRPPVNRKGEVYAVNDKHGLSLERVKFDPGHPIDVLKSPPREFRSTYLRPLPPASVPRMEARATERIAPREQGCGCQASEFSTSI
jgi:hypothetical protein